MTNKCNQVQIFWQNKYPTKIKNNSKLLKICYTKSKFVCFYFIELAFKQTLSFEPRVNNENIIIFTKTISFKILDNFA